MCQRVDWWKESNFGIGIGLEDVYEPNPPVLTRAVPEVRLPVAV
jgi:hypothetical protein